MKLRKLITCVLSLLLFTAPVQAAAYGTKIISGQDAAAVLLDNRQQNVLIQQPNAGTGIKLPAKHDLRELGVVTPVKFQNPFGTCWGFAAIAAAETSILSEMGRTYAETGMDLSEHHVTYFSRVPVVDDTQNGEGWHIADNTSIFNTGGEMFMASSVFSSGIGVVQEDMIPYRGLESKTDNVLFINISYSEDDDWTLPEEYRLVQSYQLEESSLLPSPAVYKPGTSEDYIWEREQNYLGYDASATENIKKELLQGRAVSIAFCADQAMPGYDGPIKYLNTETWAHYTFNGASATHAVTIVGYDDNYPVSNFLDHTNDPKSDGLAHLPEGNGAWIVKNSWGASTEEFPNSYSWGLPDEKGKSTGYFYLSYYDRSLRAPETFDFDVTPNESSYMIEQYDFLPSANAAGWLDTEILQMANLFTAEDDGLIHNVSCETSVENSSVTYEVFLLDDDAQIPTDGTLAATGQAVYRYAGYHRLALPQPIPVTQGQRYAVVVTQTASVNDMVYYSLSTNCALNEAGVKAHNYMTYLDNSDASEKELNSKMEHAYAVGVVNPGESMVYIDALGGWADWSDIIPEFQKTREFQYMDFDNFPVKAYLSYSDTEHAAAESLPEIKFAPPAKLINITYLLTVLAVCAFVLIAVIVLIVYLIVRAVKLHRHPELRKPKKLSYKKLKAQLDDANSRIAQLEQEKTNLL